MPRLLLQPQNTPTSVANRIGIYAKTIATEDKLVYQTDDGVEHVVSTGTDVSQLLNTANGVATTDSNNRLVQSVDASKVVGTLNIANIPAVALERLTPVANQAARYALTTNDVQNGDSVKEIDTGSIFIVVDDTKLSSADGYVAYAAGTAGAVAWTGVTNVPQNIADVGSLTASDDDIIQKKAGTLTNRSLAQLKTDLNISSGILWVSATSATNAINKNGYLLNSTSASFTVTLPASPTVGNEIGFLDVGGVCTTKPVTVARNGNLIQGLAENLVIDFNSAAFSLVYSSTGWRVNNFIKGVKGEQGTPGFGGMWALVERWEPGATATSHTFTGLNGNIDRQYKIKASIINASSSAGSLLLQINNDTDAANYKNWRNYSQIAVSGAGFHISYHEAVCTLWVNMDIQAKSGIYRSSITNGSRLISNGSDGSGDQSNSFWLNTTNEITSLTIYSNAANSIGAGSCIELWKLSAGNTQSLDFGGAL